MPKSRKTKAKYKDFQKVKLKVGKKLPKADNVTDASFKSRGIHIKDQLKSSDSSGQPTTRRKQDLNDLLSHCSHHNVSMRLDAVTGLREIIIEDQLFLRAHLSSVLERVPDLCIDKEGTVRHAVHRFFKAALPHIPEKQITPFFSILSAHLGCAMTHIDDEIQLDSLLLFDLFMDHYPQLLVTSNSSLLTNFIEQISRKSSSASTATQSKNAGKTSGRALLVNPNSKLSSRKGRIQVLERLHKYLKAVLDQRQPVILSDTCQSLRTVTVTTDKPVFYQPIGSTWINPQFVHRLLQGGRSVKVSGTDVLSNSKKLESLIDVLLPLMLQCWIEVGPAQLSTDLPGNVMSRDSMSTLGNILKVILLLLKCVELCDNDTNSTLLQTVRESYLNDFVQHYLPCFPYAMHEAPVSDKKKAPKVEPVMSVLSLNLTVCEVMSYFAESTSGRTPPAWLRKLTTFTLQCTKQQLDSEQLQSLLRFMGKLLKSKLDQETEEELMSCACMLFTTRHRLSRDRLLLLDFISDHVTMIYTEERLSMPCVQKWLGSLPQILVQSCGQNEDVTTKIIDIIRHISPLHQEALLEALQKHCQDLIAALDRLSPSLQSSLVEVLYWVPVWTRCLLEALARTTHRCNISPTHLHKLLVGIVYRYQQDQQNREEHSVFQFADFFSFVLTVAVGASLGDLRDPSSIVQQHLLDPKILNTWRMQMEYAEVISNILLLFPNTSQIISLLNTVITQIFEDHSPLPLPAGVSLLRIMIKLHNAVSSVIPLQRPLVITTMVSTAVRVVTTAAETQTLSVSEPPAVCPTSWEEVRDLTIKTYIDLLGRSPDSIISFITEMFHKMTDCHDRNTVYPYVYILRQLQQDVKLRPAMTGYSENIHNVIQQLQEKIPELQSEVWWSGLKYEVSILQPKQR